MFHQHRPDTAVLLETWMTQDTVLRGFKYNYSNCAIHTGARQSGGTQISSNSLLYNVNAKDEFFQYTKFVQNGILFIVL